MVEVDGGGAFPDISLNRIVPAALISFTWGIPNDLEEPPADKGKRTAFASSASRAVRKADRDTCMARRKRATDSFSHYATRVRYLKV